MTIRIRVIESPHTHWQLVASVDVGVTRFIAEWVKWHCTNGLTVTIIREILPYSRKLMLCLTFLPLANYFDEISNFHVHQHSAVTAEILPLTLSIFFYFSSFWNFYNTFSTWNMHREYKDEAGWRIKDAKNGKHGEYVFISFLHAWEER